MSDTTKKILKVIGAGVLWVYILSIRTGGHTLFYFANDILVQNQIVEAIDQTLVENYEKLEHRIKTAWTSVIGGQNRG